MSEPNPSALPEALADDQPDDQRKSLTGTVLAAQANYYWVKLSQQAAPLLCTSRARLKKIGQQVMVGDHVRVEEPDWVEQRGAVAEVFARRSQIERPPIANVDQILLVFALLEPTLDPTQLSRFLVKAESTGISTQLCLNKSDLASEAEQQHWTARLRQWGYDPILLSLRQGEGYCQLYDLLNQKITVLSGPSGVGKSSLINRLIPQVKLRTGLVSGKLGRGRHTTRHVELFELPTGGLLADTPGFNQPDLTCTPAQLADCFPEIRQRRAAGGCQFNNCLHRDEPNCIVRGNTKRGNAARDDWERYPLYLTFLAEVLAHQQDIDQRSDGEATTKAKSKSAGVVKDEPRLAAAYRQVSRKTEKQQLRQLYRDEQWPDPE